MRTRIPVATTLALALAVALPLEAAAAPKLGRWIGVRKGGERISFMIMKGPGGRRYIANEVWICGRNGVARSTDLMGRRALAWPLDGGGRIRDLSRGLNRKSIIKGRLGHRRGRVRLLATDGDCPASMRTPVRVRRVRSRPIRNGTWHLGENANGSSVSFDVLGGAAIMDASGQINVPRFGGLFEGFPCGRRGSTVFPDTWIEPNASFAVGGGSDGFSLSGRFARHPITKRWTVAGGSYAFAFPANCGNGPFGFGAGQVRAQIRPRANGTVLRPLTARQMR